MWVCFEAEDRIRGTRKEDRRDVDGDINSSVLDDRQGAALGMRRLDSGPSTVLKPTRCGTTMDLQTRVNDHYGLCPTAGQGCGPTSRRADGIVVLGSIGEVPQISYTERLSLFKTTDHLRGNSALPIPFSHEHTIRICSLHNRNGFSDRRSNTDIGLFNLSHRLDFAFMRHVVRSHEVEQ